MTELAVLALRNLRRHPLRTGLTGLTVAVGTALAVVAVSWLTGVLEDTLARAAEPAGHVRVVHPDYPDREPLLPLDLYVSTDLVDVLAAARGVRSVHARMTLPAQATVDETWVPTAIVGTDRAWRERLDLPAFAEGEALVGASLRARLGLSAGDELVLLARTVDGALSPASVTVRPMPAGLGPLDLAVVVDLARAQWLADLPDAATEIVMYGDDRDDAEALAASLTDIPLAQAWSQRQPWAAVLAVTRFLRRLLEGILALVTALGVWNTTMMSVLERRAELGVLRAMGMTGGEVVALVTLEATVVGLVGSVVGVSVGSLAALRLETTGWSPDPRVTENLPLAIPRTLYADFDLDVAIAAFALGVVTAFVGSLVPAIRAARIQPIEAIRSGTV
jgi:ABC-type lipoprotein release transport system permease subunit